MYVVIMGGGSGKRFWPKSREALPKQFLKIAGEKSMLRETFDRAKDLTKEDKIFVVTHKNFVSKTKEDIPQISYDNILAEPDARNTAPCIALSLFYLTTFYPKEDILFIPADHFIKDNRKFAKAVLLAQKRVEKTKGLVIFGIKPRYPETGYGYIKKGKASDKINGKTIFEVKAFVEKPNKKKALQYIKSKNYLWNSGMFLFNADRLENSIKSYLPSVFEKFNNADLSSKEDFKGEKLASLYSGLPSISVDYALIEKESKVDLVECDFDWSDVGNWRALEEIWKSDKNGNVIKGNHFVKDSSRVIADVGEKMFVALGVEDLILIDTKDVVFVCKKDSVDKLKEMLEEMKDKGLKEFL